MIGPQQRRAQDMRRFKECYVNGVAELPYPPISVSIEPTNHCNLRCPMCPVSQDYHATDRGFMSAEVFERVLHQLGQFKPEVSMNVGGESTLHPRLPEMTSAVVRSGMTVSLDTNATRLTEHLATRLIESGLHEIVLCLDGESPLNYEQMRLRARFEDTLQAIRVFLSLRRRLGSTTPRVVVKNIRDYRPGEQLRFADSFRDLFAGDPPDELRATWTDYWPGSHRYALTRAYGVEPVTDEYSPCINLWKHLAVSWDGKVYICCLDLKRTTPIGDLTTSDVMDVWNAPTMIRYRQQHADNDQARMSLCRNCNQIRRPPADPEAGLSNARQDRFTPWSKEMLPVIGQDR